ncbi:MAG: hypothetical protein WCJ40_21780 [Planctomycetota bacterium]
MKQIAILPKPSYPNVDDWVKDRPLAEMPMKRLTIDIPVTLHQRVKSQCALKGQNMADMVRILLETEFNRESSL